MEVKTKENGNASDQQPNDADVCGSEAKGGPDGKAEQPAACSCSATPEGSSDGLKDKPSDSSVTSEEKPALVITTVGRESVDMSRAEETLEIKIEEGLFGENANGKQGDAGTQAATEPQIGTQLPEGKSLDAAADERLSRFHEELQKEKSDFELFTRLFARCHEVVGCFRTELPAFCDLTSRVIDKADYGAADEFPEELKKTLDNSKVGLKLVLKMFLKLQDRIPNLDSAVPPGDARFEELDETRLVELEGQDRDDYLEELGNRNYSVVSGMRRLAEDTRDNFLSFLRKHAIMAVDGIMDGQRHFHETQKELLERYPDHQNVIDCWFEVYGTLKELTANLLLQFNVDPIIPEKGQPVDYDLHEPFSTIEDPNAENETVHEVNRPGYAYKGTLYDTHPVIRPAQVVVVKNI